MKVIFFFMAILWSTLLFASNSTLNDYFANMAMQALNMEASDVTLQDMSGNERLLSTYKGRWILLSFWASWCGPCMSEMGSLEALSKSVKAAGIDVVGVSVDNSLQEAKKVARGQNLSFDIYFDHTGKARNSYFSTSIPVTYLINPEMKIIGVAKGARKWENFGDDLVAISKIKNLDMNKLVSEQKSFNPTENLVPPKIKLIVPTGKIETNKEYEVVIKLSWEGSAIKYAIKAPEVKLSTSVVAGEMFSKSSSDGESSTLLYVLPVKFLESKETEIGPVELSYSSRVGGGEQFVRAPAEKIVVAKKEFLSLIYILVTLIVLFATAFILYSKLIRKKGANVSIVSDSGEKLFRFEELKRESLKLGPANYTESLIKFLIDLKSDETEIRKLKLELEGIKFGGVRVESMKTRFYEQEINRALSLEIVEE